MSSTTGGESSVVQMLGSLYDAIEKDFGGMPTRLYRAFRPKIRMLNHSLFHGSILQKETNTNPVLCLPFHFEQSKVHHHGD